MIDQLDLHVRRGAEIGYRGGGQPADPEEGVDLAVLECVDGFGDPEPLALHVLVLVEPGGLDDAERHHLGRAAGRAGGHALALEVGQFLDPGAFDAHHVHAVRVEHHERADLDRAALELVLALERIERGVNHHERDFALLRTDQFEIVDRAAGHARGRLHPGHVFGQHIRHAAAERVIDPAGTAGRDGDIEPWLAPWPKAAPAIAAAPTASAQITSPLPFMVVFRARTRMEPGRPAACTSTPAAWSYTKSH